MATTKEEIITYSEMRAFLKKWLHSGDKPLANRVQLVKLALSAVILEDFATKEAKALSQKVFDSPF